jgi:hypothetical protein
MSSGIAPLCNGADYLRKWKQLSQRMNKGLDKGIGEVDFAEVDKIDDERRRLERCNTPLTLDHLYSFREELDKRLLTIEENLKRS